MWMKQALVFSPTSCYPCYECGGNDLMIPLLCQSTFWFHPPTTQRQTKSWLFFCDAILWTNLIMHYTCQMYPSSFGKCTTNNKQAVHFCTDLYILLTWAAYYKSGLRKKGDKIMGIAKYNSAWKEGTHPNGVLSHATNAISPILRYWPLSSSLKPAFSAASKDIEITAIAIKERSVGQIGEWVALIKRFLSHVGCNRLIPSFFFSWILG